MYLITSVIKNNCTSYDMKVKRARYIAKNNELLQEFSFAHYETKIKVNQIFNCHFTGGPLWDLFSDNFKSVENTFNVSVRKMLNIPRNTHKYLIEPLSKSRHIQSIIIKRFLSFTEQLKKSPKIIARKLFKTIKYDATSVSGSNLRNIMILVKKSLIDDLNPNDSDSIKYWEAGEENKWRIEIAKELLEVQSGNM